MKVQNFLFLSSAVAVFFALVAIRPGDSSHTGDKPGKKVPAASALAPAPRVDVDAYTVKAATIDDELQTTGTVQANQEVNLVSEVARKVTGIYAREGSFVRKGTLLFSLDDADLQAKRKKLVLQEKLALLDEKRFRELLATESVNQQEYDQVSTNLKVLQAEIGILDVDLDKTRIRAPFAGRIGLSRVDVGAYVTPSTVLASLEDVSRVEVQFTVPEKYASELKPGQPIRFTTENSNLPFQGEVTATEPRTDLNTRSLLVKAVSDNRAGKLVPGSSAKIQFSLHQTRDGILVPTQALIPTPKGYSLFAIRNGQAEAREVKTGTRTKATVQILEGLALGDTVITTNLLRLAPGVPVRVVSAE